MGFPGEALVKTVLGGFRQYTGLYDFEDLFAPTVIMSLSKSISDFFKKVLTIPLLDYLAVEIEKRLVYKNINWKEKN